MKWKTPVIIEITIELEINAYGCAEVKITPLFVTPAGPARQPMLDAVVLESRRWRGFPQWNSNAPAGGQRDAGATWPLAYLFCSIGESVGPFRPQRITRLAPADQGNPVLAPGGSAAFATDI